MKKFFSFVLSLALFVSLMCTPLFALKPENEKTPDSHDTACAEDTVNSDQQTAEDSVSCRAETIDGVTRLIADQKYFFETRRASNSDMHPLTSEELALSTDELVDLIVKYDLLSGFQFCSGTDKDAYRIRRERCNALPELESRPDAASVLLSKWIQFSLSEDEAERDYSRYLLTLLAQTVYADKLTESEKATFATCVESFRTGKVSTHAYVPESFVIDDFVYYLANAGVTTMSGNEVYLYATSDDYSDDEKISVAETVAREYGATLIDYATSHYNCHSYAWYSQTTSNPYWLSDINPYVNDKHCSLNKIVDLSDVKVGSIAVYAGPNNEALHSAVVTSVSNGVVMCRSKWGPNGLFEHNLLSVPSDYTLDGYNLRIGFFTYTTHHTCIITNRDTSTHTRTCSICNWSSTEPHVEYLKTGMCKICGLMGPFTKYSIPEQPLEKLYHNKMYTLA